jgi:hypothetical protein
MALCFAYQKYSILSSYTIMTENTFMYHKGNKSEKCNSVYVLQRPETIALVTEVNHPKQKLEPGYSQFLLKSHCQNKDEKLDVPYRLTKDGG